MNGEAQQSQKEETRETGKSVMPEGASSAKKDVKSVVGQLEALLDEYMVKKAPFQLPLGLKEFIVKVSPYLIILFAVMALPFILAALGLSTALTPFAMMGGYGWGLGMIIAVVTTVVVLILEVMAVPGLFKRSHAGWRLIFYATIVNLIGSVLAFNILGAILGALIGWYVLFQVKEFYKN